MTQELQTNQENGAEQDVSKVFAPQVDIYETDNDIFILADMPGVDENSVDVTLEKNVLSISGAVEAPQSEGYNLAYAEFETGSYKRSFTLSNSIDRENIQATVKDGVLNVTLPRLEPQSRKIAVQSA